MVDPTDGTQRHPEESRLSGIVCGGTIGLTGVATMENGGPGVADWTT
jgi:hypothetical protein